MIYSEIPSNYRRVKRSDKILRGDLYQRRDGGLIEDISHDAEAPVNWYPDYNFWRKRKEKKVVVSKDTNKTKEVLVTFVYPSSKNGSLKNRVVKLVSLDDTYLTGIEQLDIDDEYSEWQFKKFLRNRIPQITLVSFE